jgi:transcriptional regulator
MDDLFARFEPADVRDLIAQFPFAWLTAPGGGAQEAAQLPLLGEFDQGGTLCSLLGHIPRRHPLVESLREKTAALVLFRGPHCYVSPDQAGVSDWAPTWNFAQLSIEVEIEFVPHETSKALETLVAAMEAERAKSWELSALGDRYATLADRVIAFRAHTKRVVGRFKLGQDEQPEVRRSIIASLGDTPLAAWMTRFDRD